jgi:hypothetical protein
MVPTEPPRKVDAFTLVYPFVAIIFAAGLLMAAKWLWPYGLDEDALFKILATVGLFSAAVWQGYSLLSKRLGLRGFWPMIILLVPGLVSLPIFSFPDSLDFLPTYVAITAILLTMALVVENRVRYGEILAEMWNHLRRFRVQEGHRTGKHETGQTPQ